MEVEVVSIAICGIEYAPDVSARLDVMCVFREVVVDVDVDADVDSEEVADRVAHGCGLYFEEVAGLPFRTIIFVRPRTAS